MLVGGGVSDPAFLCALLAAPGVAAAGCFTGVASAATALAGVAAAGEGLGGRTVGVLAEAVTECALGLGKPALVALDCALFCHCGELCAYVEGMTTDR